MRSELKRKSKRSSVSSSREPVELGLAVLLQLSSLHAS